MSVRLSCVDAVSTLDEISLTTLPATIGRGEEADVCVHDSWASRIHCTLVERDGSLWVEDGNSSNGTRLNGQDIKETQLKSGDELTVGITTFRVTFGRLPGLRQTASSAAGELVGS